MIITPGTTSVSIDVQIVDDSGAAVTGLVAATFPAVYYSVAGPNAAVQITPLSDLAAITTAFTAKGVKERAGSAGVYRLDVPDAAFASAGQLTIYGEASGKHLLVPGGTITVGYIAANVVQNRGTSAPAPTTAGVPKVEVEGASSNGTFAIANGVDISTAAANAATLVTRQTIRSGTAQAGGATSITLDASASGVTDFYAGDIVWVGPGGVGVGQARRITAYNGTTKVATVSPAWATNPDNTSGFVVMPAVRSILTAAQTFDMTGNVIGNLTGSAGSVASAVTVGTNNDKTGYTATVSDKTGFKLASDGLNAIDVTAPTTVAATFPQMVNQLWRRFFKKATKNASQTKTYADDGTTIVTTQAISDDGTTQTQGPAT